MMVSNNNLEYKAHTVVSPPLVGLPLALMAILTDNIGKIIGLNSFLARISGLFKLRGHTELPTSRVITHPVGFNILPKTSVTLELNVESSNESHQGFRRFSAFDLHEAYLSKKTTPLEVAEKLLDYLKASENLVFINQYNENDILAQARSATARYEKNSSRGSLDGVPIIVKDDSDVQGYETRNGTCIFNQQNPAVEDSFPVAKLRQAGAIIIGKANMIELGFDMIGGNMIAGSPRNPYNTAHYCGGSSSGSACAVSCGIVPIAVGSDGGGSIRLPSSFCGVFGLKPTHDRVSTRGFAGSHFTVAVVGPIATTAQDLALAYSIMAQPDQVDSELVKPEIPPVTLAGFNNIKDLSDVTIGIYPDYFNDVRNNEITLACSRILDLLKLRGARVVEFKFPDLDRITIAHLVSIGMEILAEVQHHPKRNQLSYHNRLQLNIIETLTFTDYFYAQKVRTRAMEILRQIYEEQKIDAIITPTSGITAPKISSNSALKYGEHDSMRQSYGMRFAFLPNFLGVPAVSIPAGYDTTGMPIGVQFMASWYNEALLLRIANTVQDLLYENDILRKPSNFFTYF
ncbi:uncharacterized protein VTP21DRAFT_6732 [Calcarisporiella thermophila]|uniref:uncharacterized protein n=1 Tax=Calcarisporiella thermophila TaxID=911321 RepID=UPI003742234B